MRRGDGLDRHEPAEQIHSIPAYVTGAAIVVDGGLSLINWLAPPDLDEP